MTVPCLGLVELRRWRATNRPYHDVRGRYTSEKRYDLASPVYGDYHDSSVFDPDDAVCIEEFDEIGFLASCGVEACYMRVRGNYRWR